MPFYFPQDLCRYMQPLPQKNMHFHYKTPIILFPKGIQQHVTINNEQTYSDPRKFTFLFEPSKKVHQAQTNSHLTDQLYFSQQTNYRRPRVYGKCTRPMQNLIPFYIFITQQHIHILHTNHAISPIFAHGNMQILQPHNPLFVANHRLEKSFFFTF